MPVLPPTTPSPRHPAASGKEALLVFLGTFGVAALILVAAILVAPDRFGLRRAVDDVALGSSGGSSGGSPGRTSGGSDGGPEAGTGAVAGQDERVTDGSSSSEPGPWSSGGSVSALDPDGYDLAETEPGFVLREELQGDPWSRFEREFAPRPTEAEADPFGPRPSVERAPSDPSLAQRIFEDARASVAHVTTLSIHTQPAHAGPGSPATEDADSTQVEPRSLYESVAGTGSGLVWDRSGHIVTSRHVIENVGGANVTLADGTSWQAKLIGVDAATDIAVLQIAAQRAQLTPIRVGTSHDLAVGMSVFSVACPYGLGHSLSTGSISGLNRRIQSTIARTLRGTIQTDAPLHPGSSGGALIDDQARVIGMNTAIHMDSGRAPGVGFALPIDRLQVVVPALIRGGQRWYPEFGFMTESAAGSRARLTRIEEEIARSELPGSALLARLGDSPLPLFGLVVTEIDPSGPADEAGLRGMVMLVNTSRKTGFYVRDVVVQAGGLEIRSPSDLERVIKTLLPEEPLALGIWRRGTLVPLTIDRLPR